MVDLTWKLFSQTGNIETYLLLKEMEQQQSQDEISMEDTSTLDPN